MLCQHYEQCFHYKSGISFDQAYHSSNISSDNHSFELTRTGTIIEVSETS